MNKEEKRLETVLVGLTKEELASLVINESTKKELINIISSDPKYKKIILKEIKEDKIPLSIFNAGLSPLESITRYLRENLKKRTTQIAKLLNKKLPAISLAYKNSLSKQFIIRKTNIYIPLSEFQDNPKLSILEVIVQFFRNKDLKFTEIAKLLGRNSKTIWTIDQRAKKKNE